MTGSAIKHSPQADMVAYQVGLPDAMRIHKTPRGSQPISPMLLPLVTKKIKLSPGGSSTMYYSNKLIPKIKIKILEVPSTDVLLQKLMRKAFRLTTIESY